MVEVVVALALERVTLEQVGQAAAARGCQAVALEQRLAERQTLEAGAVELEMDKPQALEAQALWLFVTLILIR
jgi:hypothetical protein